MSLPDLHELLETTHQILLPRLANCSHKFLKQLLTGEKKPISLFDARHFWLTEIANTKAKKLAALCDEDQELRKYVPDAGVPDREFLVQVLATVRLSAIIEKQKEVLSRKYRIAPESAAIDKPFVISQELDEQAFIASAVPEQ